MEDLAAEFNMKTQVCIHYSVYVGFTSHTSLPPPTTHTQEAISRVQNLQESGELSGVVDDRGKFIFISKEELQAVASFIKQRGRVSIVELVSSSNRLINLQPEKTVMSTVTS